MPAAPFPPDEAERLDALYALQILDTPPEERFDRIARLARRLFDVPIVLVTLVDANRQWFKACIGIEINETPRSLSFCAHAIASDEMLVIEDTLNDARFVDNPFVSGPPHIRFYAGQPLMGPGGHRLGTLCVIDVKARAFSADDRAALGDLAHMAENELGGVEITAALRARHASEAQLRAVLDAVADGILTFDAAGAIRTANRAAGRIFGGDPGALVGRSVASLLAEASPGLDGLLPVADAPSDGPTHVVEARRANGEHFPLALAITRVDDPAGLFSAIVRDVSDQQRIRETLQAAKEEAERNSRAKSMFLANMSHELRTPLNAIIGYSELLLEEAEEAQRPSDSADLKKIHGAGKQLLGLINDILDLSKIEAGKMDLYLEETAVATLIDDVAATVRPLVAQKSNRLVVEVAADLPPLATDVTKLRQILYNLLSNAAKFTESGTIGLRVTREQADWRSWLCFEVVDSGIGMSDEQIGRLFREFSQADASTTRRFGGTGLGLAIASRFAELLGGAIAVTSALGRGSTFTLRVPLALYETPAPPIAPEPPSARARKLVLVIDDAPVMRELMSRYLAKEGYEVRTAAGGREGLEQARAWRPDAITLDVNMPGIDGWSVLTALKEDPLLADIPVIMLTMVDDKSKGMALGVAAYLVKPFDRNRMAPLLGRLLQLPTGSDLLVVDDDPAQRELLRRTLEREGWAVREAAHGNEAMARIAECAPALILLDLTMPEMDGFEFLGHLQANPEWATIPVIVVTGAQLDGPARSRLEGAVARILHKGAYDREALLADVKKLLERALTPPASQAPQEG